MTQTAPRISRERLAKFIELYQRAFGVTLDEAEATKLGSALVGTVSLVQAHVIEAENDES